MAKAYINPGICGLNTQLTIAADEMQMVTVDIQSECPYITAMKDELSELDGYGECLPNNQIDPNYKAKLNNEIDYIFLWGLDGLKRLLANNFQFTEADESVALKTQYKKDSDPVKLYLEENILYDSTIDIGLESVELYKAYKTWCIELGYAPVNNSVFGSAIIKKFGSIKKQRRNDKKKVVSVYIGLKYIS